MTIHPEYIGPDTLVRLLLNTFDQGALEPFRSFLAKYTHIARWMIVSDFVIGDPHSFHDVYAFTLFPSSVPIEQLISYVGRLAPRDLKKTKVISDGLIAYFRSGGTFSICLVTPKGYRVAGGIEDVRASLDQTIKSMESWNNANTQSEIINAFRTLKQRSRANSFKAPLISAMMISTTLAAFSALLLAREHDVEIVGWFPDRDSITSAYDGIASLMFSVNFSAFCQQRSIRNERIKLAIGEPNPTQIGGADCWYDNLVRVPDAIAGALAAWDYKNGKVRPNVKFVKLLKDGLADNPNMIVLSLVKHEAGVQIGRLAVSRSPISSARV